MGLRIQNNIEAFNTHRQLTQSGAAASKSMEKLSSGYRINKAADDAAGLGISEKMRSQISGLDQSQRNAQDAVSLVQTAEGALGEVHSMLERVRDLRVQIGNDTLAQSDKDSIGAEVKQIATEIGEILNKTEFNGKKLLDGSGSGFTFQVGANDNDTISMGTSTLSATGSSGIGDIIALSSGTSTQVAGSLAATSLSSITDDIEDVSTQRGTYGAIQNRLEHRLTNLATYQENLTASESRIRDVDMASEMTKFTKLNILQQAGTSMLAQANQAPQGVLSLLR
jgi:flagellin